MKDPYIKIKMSELTLLNNRITLLEQRLREYEPPTPEVKLLNRNGSPRVTHPLFKPGPKSILETLPESFTRQQAYNAGADAHRLSIWKHRKYITQDGDEFAKTELYKERLRQAQLTNLSDEFVVNKISN